MAPRSFNTKVYAGYTSSYGKRMTQKSSLPQLMAEWDTCILLNILSETKGKMPSLESAGMVI
jgi:hypothetical protein